MVYASTSYDDRTSHNPTMAQTQANDHRCAHKAYYYQTEAQEKEGNPSPSANALAHSLASYPSGRAMYHPLPHSNDNQKAMPHMQTHKKGDHYKKAGYQKAGYQKAGYQKAGYQKADQKANEEGSTIRFKSGRGVEYL